MANTPVSSTPAIPTAASPAAFADDRITVSSIAVLAFIVADIAHEGAGHIFGFYLAGGKSALLTTTHLTEWVALGDPQWRIFDLGGPAGNLASAFLAWLILRSVRKRPVQLQFFLWLVMAFSLFWAFGSMIFCGVTGRGDWMALIQGTKFLWPVRILFVLLGLFLYRISIRLLAMELRSIISISDPNISSRLARLIWISYISGGLIACAGAILDPHGPIEMLRSGALSSFGAAIGLFYIRRNFLRLTDRPPDPPAANPIRRDLPWILAALAGAIYFIGILGPGIQIWLGD
jgi:hypothetical protein